MALKLKRPPRMIDAAAERELGGLRAYEVLASPEDARMLDELEFGTVPQSSKTNQSETPPDSSVA